MGIAHAENGRPIIVNGENGLPGPDGNGDYPLVVYADWYDSPDSPRAATELGEVTTVRIDAKDSVVAVHGLHQADQKLH